MRLQILDLLRRSDQCVCHLSAALDRPQPYVSQQLAILRDTGLISDRKAGTNVFYSLSDPALKEMLDAILGDSLADNPGSSTIEHVALAGCPCPRCCSITILPLDPALSQTQS
jgi:ArsR family transcriptional regulator